MAKFSEFRAKRQRATRVRQLIPGDTDAQVDARTTYTAWGDFAAPFHEMESERYTGEARIGKTRSRRRDRTAHARHSAKVARLLRSKGL